MDHDYRVAIWTVADLHDLVERHGYRLSAATIYRTLERLGYPRHDLTHRQDGDAVASAKPVLADLQGGLFPEPDSGLSMWMNSTSTPVPTWQESGSARAIE